MNYGTPDLSRPGFYIWSKVRTDRLYLFGEVEEVDPSSLSLGVEITWNPCDLGWCKRQKLLYSS